jgi:hypothetical protein
MTGASDETAPGRHTALSGNRIARPSTHLGPEQAPVPWPTRHRDRPRLHPHPLR